MNPIVDKAIYEKISSQYGTIPHYDIDEQHVKIPAVGLLNNADGKDGPWAMPAYTTNRLLCL